ncbi:MAG: PQQ-dependent sugar dehydrogenase [Lentisphaerales bacterium]|nr:PQQ-dependent sugar dehydrogenase [Lentisphaerales bacterium]
MFKKLIKNSLKTLALLSLTSFSFADGDPELEVNILGEKLFQAMEMSIASDGRVFVAERNGQVQLYDPKTDNMQVILELKSDMRGESGLIGLALAPNFDKSGWIYMYHTVEFPDDSLAHMHHLARFTYKNGKIDRASEKVLLKVKATIKRIHEARSISFDKEGNLYLSTGDNQYKKEYQYSCKTTADSNDLRGKILRITPQPDGAYTIPEGNLYKPGTPKTKPEIYVMGLRNPFRIHVDKETGWVLWGENGPPDHFSGNAGLDKALIPKGYDEFNLAKAAGFYGYPLVIGNQEAFVNYDPINKKVVAKVDPNAPVNIHPENKGLRNLPPSQPPLIWYSGLQEEFPEFGTGGESAIAGPIYRSKPSYDAGLKLPEKYEHSWFVGDYARGWVKAVKLDGNGKIKSISPVMQRIGLGQPTNLKIGPKGRLHVLYFNREGMGHLVRLENRGKVSGSVAYDTIQKPDRIPRSVGKKHLGRLLMANSDCMSCNQWSNTLVGPSFVTIAQKYKGQKNIMDGLIQKVIDGGAGTFGHIPMNPHPQHTKKEIEKMVGAILRAVK